MNIIFMMQHFTRLVYNKDLNLLTLLDLFLNIFSANQWKNKII